MCVRGRLEELHDGLPKVEGSPRASECETYIYTYPLIQNRYTVFDIII